MALLKAGWWQTTWWPSGYWQEDYWLEYGAGVPPAVVAPTGHVWLERERRRKLSPNLLRAIRDYLETET